MVDQKKALHTYVRFCLQLALFIGAGLLKSYGQDPSEDTFALGKIAFPSTEDISSFYTYDPEQDRYIFSATIADFPIGTPLVLTPAEFEKRLLKQQMNAYFQQKITLIGENKGEDNAAQKDLLPELYVNSKFFSSIFGSNQIDVRPQGSIGIDLGVRYQRTDNPSFSPRNRRNFGFDFDQRISLSLIGDIGERLQITANYDTESTFDFQNLVKLQFNPPKVNELSNYLPESLSERVDDIAAKGAALKGRFDEVRGKIDNVKGKLQAMKDKADNLQGNVGNYQNKINDFLNREATEDAILQNIDIGNINMPLNSTLISGAQSLMGVKAQLKFGRTNITGVFAEQRSQTQSVIAQGGGTLQEFSIFALDYEADRHFFLAHYFRDNYDRFLRTYPFINSPIQITRVEVWITNRQSQTNNIRNIVALQDLGESNPERTRLGQANTNFFNVPLPNGVPANEANKLNPEQINAGSFITEGIRDVGTLAQSFGALNGQVQEGFDYAFLESARKLEKSEYTLHPQLGYISLNQRLSNDEILGVAFQFTYQGQVYQVGEFANGGIAGTSLGATNDPLDPNNVGGFAQVETNNLVVKLLKSSLTDVRQPVWNLMMKNIYNTGAFQLEQEDFRLNILYSDPSPLNYLTPVDESIWPEELTKSVLLRSLRLDRLNIYNDPEPEGDGFFDFIPGITVDQQYGRIIFPTVEPFGESLFEMLSDPQNTIESYDDESTYNPNQAKYVFRDMYALTQAAALEDTEKNKYELKGRYKSAGGDGIAIGAFNVPRGSVQVTAGGRVLREGVDYTVNYQIGRVKILDPALEASNIPIQISVENNTFLDNKTNVFQDLISPINSMKKWLLEEH